jgi:hypothetical protein
MNPTIPKIFNANDFDFSDYEQNVQAGRRAATLLNEYLQNNAIIFYTHKDNAGKWLPYDQGTIRSCGFKPTHIFYGAFFTEHKNVDCVYHEPQPYFDNRFGIYYGAVPKCVKCGAVIKPKWELAYDD